MRTFLKTAVGTAVGWAALASSALANTSNCGPLSGTACTVPEPGTWALVAIAAVGAVVVAKSRRK